MGDAAKVRGMEDKGWKRPGTSDLTTGLPIGYNVTK
jgi:hypothetical protein